MTVVLKTRQISKQEMNDMNDVFQSQQRSAGLSITGRKPQGETRSSPDCLILQPAGGTAGKAIVIGCPQLGCCGNMSWVFQAGLLCFGKWKGILCIGGLVVKHHTYGDTGRFVSLLYLRNKPKVSKSGRWNVTANGTIRDCVSLRWNSTAEHIWDSWLMF